MGERRGMEEKPGIPKGMESQGDRRRRTAGREEREVEGRRNDKESRAL